MPLSNTPTSIADIITENIENIKATTTQELETIMTQNDVEAQVQAQFQEIRNQIQTIIREGLQTETKKDILKALNQTTDYNETLNQWICENIGLNYEKLKQNSDEKIQQADLSTTVPVVPQTPTQTQTPQGEKESPYHVVSAEEYKNRKQKAIQEFFSFKNDIQGILNTVLEDLSDDYPKDLKSQKYQKKVIQSFYTIIKTEYLEKGFLPKYSEISEMLAEITIDHLGRLRPVIDFFKNAVGKKSITLDKVQETIRMNISNKLNQKEPREKYNRIENLLSSCYQAGVYEKLQNDENVFENKYGHKDPDSLTVEELEYQTEYERKQVELLESLDEYEKEEYRQEYQNGVLAETLRAPFAVRFEKNKIKNMSRMDKLLYRGRKLVKPFLKLWTIMENMWDKFFDPEKELSWQEVFQTDKKTENTAYQEAKKRKESYEKLYEKKKVHEKCAIIAQGANPNHVSQLEKLSLSEIKIYEKVLQEGVQVQDKQFQSYRENLMGMAIKNVQDVQNILLLHSWKEAGYASLKNGKGEILNTVFEINDTGIENNKAFLVLQDELYTNWPSGIDLTVTDQNREKRINVLEKEDRKDLNTLTTQNIQKLGTTLRDPKVQAFLQLTKKPEVLKKIEETNTGPQKTISLSLLEGIQNTKKSVTNIDIKNNKTMSERYDEFKESSWNPLNLFKSGDDESEAPQETVIPEGNLFAVIDGKEKEIQALNDILEQI